jgi:hypothetical protein
MASIKICDCCKKPSEQFSDGRIDCAAPVDFINGNGVPTRFTVGLTLSRADNVDVCMECFSKIIDQGLADIVAKRNDQKRGVFVSGRAAAKALTERS